MDITIYSTPTCVQCESTYRALLSAGVVDFEVIAVHNNPQALEYIKTELGHQQAPVVMVDGNDGAEADHWAGFRPDRIRELVARLIEEGTNLVPLDRAEVKDKIGAIKAQLVQPVALSQDAPVGA